MPMVALSRSTVFVLLAGCADVLGIGDVPTPDASDAGVDAPFDSLVVPDGPFEGCNGGAEDCSNGVDDNCNGLVDCEDPVCQSASYQCVDRAPSGWTLVGFAAATGGTIPAGCSGAYGQTIAQGHAGINPTPAQCGCTCPSSTSTGTTCPLVAIAGYAGSTSCTGSSDQTINVGGTCVDFNPSQASLFATEGSPTSLGSCGNPTTSKTLPPVQWANSYAACGYTAADDSGGCESGSRCVKLPSTSQFDTAPCISQAGDVTCPNAMYTKKTVVFQSVDEQRGCTTCSCNASGGSCSATVTAYTGGGCSSSSVPLTLGACGAEGVSATSAVANITTTAATCSMSGGQPTGTTTATNPVTVCCP
jgi:hypothetical protein